MIVETDVANFSLNMVKTLIQILTIYFTFNSLFNVAKFFAFRNDKIKQFTAIINVLLNGLLVILFNYFLVFYTNPKILSYIMWVGAIVVPLISYLIFIKLIKNNDKKDNTNK